ncbi:hypothetical protein ACWTQY_29100, partial [Klebsiella pneumoniae]
AHQALVTQLRNGVSYGPGDENVPWRFPEDLSRALRDFLSTARALPGAEGQSELRFCCRNTSIKRLSDMPQGFFLSLPEASTGPQLMPITLVEQELGLPPSGPGAPDLPEVEPLAGIVPQPD